MMMRWVGLFLLLCVLAGCLTTNEPRPVSWNQQQAYLGSVSDPRLYGLAFVETADGVRIQGGGRLHYSQSYALDMLAKKPVRPVIEMQGRPDGEWPVLMDLTAKNSLFDFDTARDLGARPVAEGRPTLMTLPGDDVSSCISLIPTLRLGQLFVEHPLVLVRMANGLSESAQRGLADSEIKGVIGWDILRKMEQIQFLYSLDKVVLKTTDGYVPNPAETVAQLSLSSGQRVCAVTGWVDGESVPVLIDPAGDFEVAVPQGTPISTLRLADGFMFSSPTVSESPEGVRMGARLLENYRVTICPKQRVVYFETLASEE